MSQSHAVSALVSLRNQFAGKMSALQQELDGVSSNIRTLDAAIKLFDPDFKLSTLKAKRTNSKNVFFAKHGEASRFVLQTLREASATLSTNEIAELAINQKGLNRSSIDLKALRACILTTLSRQRIKGIAVERGRDKDGAIMWSLGS